jgi:hypothetical protein
MGDFKFLSLIILLSACKYLGEVKNTENFCAYPSEQCEIEEQQTYKMPSLLLSLTSPEIKNYTSGEQLVFNLTFDNEVTIKGAPSFKFKIGRFEKEATCLSVTKLEVTCSYELSEDTTLPDLDFDGIEFQEFDNISGQIVGNDGKEVVIDTSSIDINSITVHYSSFTNWLDGSDLETLFSDSSCSTMINSNDSVGCWIDKKSTEAITGSGATKPIYNLNGAPNSKGSVYFNSDHLSYPTPASIQSTFTFIVVYNVVAFNTLNYLIGSTSGSTKGIGIGFGGSWTGGSAGSGLYILTKATPSSTSNTLSSTVELSNWATATYTPTKIYRDLDEATPYSSTQAIDLPQSFTRVGGRDDGNGCCHNNGNVAELLIFAQTLSNNQRGEVLCYLSGKYGFGYIGC